VVGWRYQFDGPARVACQQQSNLMGMTEGEASLGPLGGGCPSGTGPSTDRAAREGSMTVDPSQASIGRTSTECDNQTKVRRRLSPYAKGNSRLPVWKGVNRPTDLSPGARIRR